MNRPAVAAALSWIAGSALAIGGIGPLTGLPLLLFFGAAAFLCCIRRQGWKWAALLLLAAGGNGYYVFVDSRNISHIAPGPGDTDRAVMEGSLVTPVEVDGDRAVFYMEVTRWRWEGEAELKQVRKRERIYVSLRLLALEEQDVASGWQRGDRIRFNGTAKLPDPARNFGGFDFRDYLRRQHVHWMVSAKGTSAVEALQPDGSFAVLLLKWNDNFRVMAGTRLEKLFKADEAGYMKGLLIGVREDFDPERFREFSRLGLTHILAISGLHVAVYAWAVTAVLRRVRATREKSMLIVMWTIPLYVVFTGSSPSVIRAGLTAMAALFASGRGWLKDGLSLLGAAALIMLVWDPYRLLDVGFQLSFLVTAGLIAGVSVIGKLLPVRSPMWNGSLAVALTAQLVSFPVSVYYFNQFALTSLPANLLLVPVISFVVTPLGYGALLLSTIFPLGGRLLAQLTSWLNAATFWSVERMDQASWGRLIWPSPPLWWIAAYYVLLGSALIFLRRRQEVRELERQGLYLLPDGPCRSQFYGRASCGAFLILVLLLVYGYFPYRFTQSGVGTVAFLDVGQGDSAYIRTPGGKHLLIDGGGTVTFAKAGEEWKARADPYEVGRKTVVPLLKKRGVHKLDYMVISHEDADHIGGLKAVLEDIPVGGILFNGTLKSSPAAEALFREAIRRNIPLIPVRAGMVVRLDGHTDLTVLNPEGGRLPAIFKAEEQNDVTLVGLLRMNGTRFLFTGDLGSKEEGLLLERLSGGKPGGLAQDDSVNGEDDGDGMIGSRSGISDESGSRVSPGTAAVAGCGADVLKIGHHGSKNSSSAEWLSCWRPAVSVISVGKNNLYGHPHPDTLKRLEEVGSKVYRTDLQGEIQVRTGPSGLSVRAKLADRAERKQYPVK